MQCCNSDVYRLSLLFKFGLHRPTSAETDKKCDAESMNFCFIYSGDRISGQFGYLASPPVVPNGGLYNESVVIYYGQSNHFFKTVNHISDLQCIQGIFLRMLDETTAIWITF